MSDEMTPETTPEKQRSLFAPLAGFGVTFRQMFRRKVTTEYPKVKREKPQRFHGRHVLNR